MAATLNHSGKSTANQLIDRARAMMPPLGGRAIYTSSAATLPPFGLHATRAHVANDPNNFGPDVAGALLGEPPSFTFL